jgi:nitrite reductase (NADH) small subunit
MELRKEGEVYNGHADTLIWYKAAHVSQFPNNGGACIKYNDQQIAVFNFARRNEWYACQNMCPHKMQMVLSRGLVGSQGAEPKVACPFHKKTFSLKSGSCTTGEDYAIKVYPVKIENDYVFIGLS